MSSKTSLLAFFVMDYIANYNALLGRDWVYANWCVLSSFHQFLLFWKGNEVELVWANKQPFIAPSDSVEASYYDQEFGLIKFKFKKKNGAPREIYMESRDTYGIQYQAAKILKTTIIMPFMPIKGSIIEEIND